MFNLSWKLVNLVLFLLLLALIGFTRFNKGYISKDAEEWERLPEWIHNYCRGLDRRRFSNPWTNTEVESVLSRARKAKLIRDSLIFIPPLNQMWCLVPKTGSTSWSRFLLEKLNLSLDDEPPQIKLKKIFGHIDKMSYMKALHNESIQKILLVRHPFDRIMSAYRDKLENRTAHADGHFFYEHYGVPIRRKYRRNHGIKQPEPTFSEFIDYLLLDHNGFDEHWERISSLCGFCNVKYSTVIRQESLLTNRKKILESIGFAGNGIIPWENKRGMEKRNNGNETSWSEYFGTISASKMTLLYKKYEMDFHTLRYSFLEYYSKGRHGKLH